jgi:hypothetical protein
MAFNLQTFKATGIPLGGARPSLFDVTITFPAVVAGAEPAATNKFTFQCQAAELPASTIRHIDVPYFGRTIKVNGERIYDNWRVNLINDEDFAVRAALEDWHYAINAIIENTMDPGVAQIATAGVLGGSYKTVATVNQYTKVGQGTPGNNEGDIIRAYRFDGIFPSLIGPVRLSWDSGHQIEVYDVEFAYDWWVPLDPALAGYSEGGINVSSPAIPTA